MSHSKTQIYKMHNYNPILFRNFSWLYVPSSQLEVKEFKDSVLVSLGWHKKIPPTGWLKQETFIFLLSWRLESQDQGPAGMVSFFLAYRHGGKRGQVSSSALLLIRGLSLSWGPHSNNLSKPNYLQDAPFPNTITLGGFNIRTSEAVNSVHMYVHAC